MTIQINDGRKTFDIQNQDGEIIASVTFKPADSNIISRVDGVAKELSDIIASVQNIDSTSEAFCMKENEIKSKINDLFNADVSTPFFNILGVFTPVGDGKVFCEQVIELLVGLVKTEYENLKKATAVMNTYLDEYETEGEPR